MAHTSLLRTVCTVALFAATPAFAQSNTPPASTGPDNTPNTPTVSEPGAGSKAPSGSAASGVNTNSAQSSMSDHPMHKSAMMKHHMQSARSDRSQNATVDQLNEQSYQAAQQGRTFDVSGGDTSTPGGSMPNGNGTSGGSTGTGVSAPPNGSGKM